MPYIVIHLICALLTLLILKVTLGEVTAGMALIALIGGPVILGMLLVGIIIQELDNITLF